MNTDDDENRLIDLAKGGRMSTKDANALIDRAYARVSHEGERIKREIERIEATGGTRSACAQLRRDIGCNERLLFALWLVLRARLGASAPRIH